MKQQIRTPCGKPNRYAWETPHKFLEKFSKNLYGTTGGTQFALSPSCHVTETEISYHVTQNEKAFLALLEHHLPDVHAYADDTRLCSSFKSDSSAEQSRVAWVVLPSSNDDAFGILQPTWYYDFKISVYCVWRPFERHSYSTKVAF